MNLFFREATVFPKLAFSTSTFVVWMPVAFVFFLFANALPAQEQAEGPKLAIVGAGVEQSEEAPIVPPDYRFLPGDYVYFTFSIAGFDKKSSERGEVQKIALRYSITPEDLKGVPLAEPQKGEIKADLNAEDKNWTPKRRMSFLLPSYLAAGEFRIRLQVTDEYAKAEVSRDFPFQLGGVHILPSPSLSIQNLEFLRHEDDRAALDVPAYSPGDTVFARFDMAGFKLAEGNTYSLEYGIQVTQPSGKPFLDAPRAADLKAASFYPVQFLPGVVRITTPPESVKGNYLLKLTVRDLVGNTSIETTKSFSVE